MRSLRGLRCTVAGLLLVAGSTVAAANDAADSAANNNLQGGDEPAAAIVGDGAVGEAAVGDGVVDKGSAAAEQTKPARQGTVIVPGSELDSMTGPLVRMVVSLAAVLALVAGLAWLLRRFRGGQLQGGLIQIVSGLSLGPKERVVLLRVGDEEVLVGLTPSGISPLHVMGRPVGDGARRAAADFTAEMERAGRKAGE